MVSISCDSCPNQDSSDFPDTALTYIANPKFDILYFIADMQSQYVHPDT